MNTDARLKDLYTALKGGYLAEAKNAALDLIDSLAQGLPCECMAPEAAIDVCQDVIRLCESVGVTSKM